MRSNPFQAIYDSPDYKEGQGKYFPYIIDVELTNHCNLNCQMCDRKRMNRVQGFMPQEVFEKIVQECAPRGTPIRLIGWGEPFLHPKIIDFVKYIKEYKVVKRTDFIPEPPLPLHITNNGQMITEEQMKELVELKLDSIIFSFQGATPQGYELMRKGASYFKVRDNILKLIDIRGDKEKPFIHVSSTMTNETKEEIKKFREYWEGIVDSVGIGKTNMHAQVAYMNYKPCLEVNRKLTVKWDGQVSACCGDYDNLLVVGDLEHYNLCQIWHGDKIEAIRKLLTYRMHRSLTLCKECVFAYEEFL